MKIEDEILYYVFDRNNNPVRIGKIIDIIEFKNKIVFYLIKPLSGGKTLTRQKEYLYKLESIEQLKQDIIQRRNNGNRD